MIFHYIEKKDRDLVLHDDPNYLETVILVDIHEVINTIRDAAINEYDEARVIEAINEMDGLPFNRSYDGKYIATNDPGEGNIEWLKNALLKENMKNLIVRKNGKEVVYTKQE